MRILINDRSKTALIVLPFAVIGVLVLQFVLVKSGVPVPWNSPNYICIAVDSNENIYLGDVGEITVINSDGEIINKIDVNSSRGFTFNIIDDRIYMDTVSGDYVTDLYGNKLDIPLTEEENNKIQRRTASSFTTKDGTKYYLSHNRVFRTKDGKTVQVYPIPNQTGGHKSPAVGHNKEGLL